MTAKILKPKNPNFARVLMQALEASPVVRFFGFEAIEIDVGRVVLALEQRPELGHAAGYFQAGIMNAIADYAACYANYTLEPANCLHRMLDQTTKFFGRAEGSRLIARGRVVNPGSTIMTGAADLFVLRDGKEHLVATSLVTTHHSVSGPERPAA
jgi:acyl-coenzyme A thioesterase PaaI-like protein